MKHKKACNCERCFDRWLIKLFKVARQAKKEGSKLTWKNFTAMVANSQPSTKRKTHTAYRFTKKATGA